MRGADDESERDSVEVSGEERLSALSDPYGDFGENRIKHLEMVQAVVGRLASNSFLVKGWAITVSGAFFGFAVSRGETKLALVGLLPIVAFWSLDAYFLRSERLFRELYERVRQCDTNVEAFFMGATSPEFMSRIAPDCAAKSWKKTLRRPSLLAFYLTLIVAMVLIVLLIRTT
jgi:hypothetical protein